jgi:hypothetical protein
MATSHDIQRMCESWWAELANATRDEHHRLAEQFLRLHGWTQPCVTETRAASVQPATLSYLPEEGLHAPFAAHFAPPGSLDPPRSVLERGLDFCPTTRTLVAATRALDVRYAFITDLFRSYLYDSRTGELLVHADTPAEYATEFGDLLGKDSVADGALHEVRRQPRSFASRQLREWLERWCNMLIMEWRAPEESAWIAMDRLIVVRYLVEHDILKRSGWRLMTRFSEVLTRASDGESAGCGKALVGLFEELAREWNASLFAPRPPIEAILQQDQVTGPLLREFVLLSRAKFNVATILESFNYGEASEKARVRMIPEEDPERLTLIAKQTPATVDDLRIEVDISDEGYRAIFYWFDQLMDLYRRLAAEYDNARYSARPAEKDLDLFGWSAIETDRPGALTDPFQHAIEHAFTIYCASPRQFRTARLMLYLHLIRRIQEAKIRFRRFPEIDGTLQRRPNVLESDRRRIYQPQRDEEWGVV